MALKNNSNNNVIYINVLSSDGTFRRAVPEGTAGAVKREYESRDGKKGTKWELIYNEVSGIISDIQFYKGDYGKNLIITFQDGEELPVTLSLNTNQNYAEDVMKKLPNIDFALPVVMKPYSFEDDNKKVRKGMTIWQSGKKIADYFYDTETKTQKNGAPSPEFKIDPKTKQRKPFGSAEWKVYFTSLSIFLVEYIENNFITKFANNKVAMLEAAQEDFENF